MEDSIPNGSLALMAAPKQLVFRTGVVDQKFFKSCIKSSAEYFSIGVNAKIHCSKTIVPVSWEKPPEGWVKLNIDDSALKNLRKAGGGG